jgi:hypothetical protein
MHCCRFQFPCAGKPFERAPARKRKLGTIYSCTPCREVSGSFERTKYDFRGDPVSPGLSKTRKFGPFRPYLPYFDSRIVHIGQKWKLVEASKPASEIFWRGFEHSYDFSVVLCCHRISRKASESKSLLSGCTNRFRAVIHARWDTSNRDSRVAGSALSTSSPEPQQQSSETPASSAGAGVASSRSAE